MSVLKGRFRLTIGTKLVSLIAVLLMSSVVSLVWLSSQLFIADNTANIQQTNADTAQSLATRYHELFDNITEKMRVLGMLLAREENNASYTAAQDAVVQEFFAKDKSVLGVMVHRLADTQGAPLPSARAISPELRNLGDADGDKLLTALKLDSGFSLARLARGDVILIPVLSTDVGAALAIGIPFIEDSAKPGAFTHGLLGFIRQAKLLGPVADGGAVTSFLVDQKGKLLAHPDPERVNAGESMVYLPIVKQMLEGGFNNGQSRYLDTHGGEARLGAFRLVGFAGLGVISEVPEAKAFEAAKRVVKRSVILALIILAISFLTGYLYSGTLTWPIKQLVAAARQISHGDFNIHLQPKSRDEIATLAGAFNDMAKGLEERDKVKATFEKFHNKEIADKLLSGEVNLGGEKKEATIFFSDVRGFTAMSESMQPEQVVEMLNEYMTRMVRVIREHHGIVDKYVGDAIMAVWGVPIPGDDDLANAVRACLAMRQELAALNDLRISRGQNPLRIGMGLNTGQVIAGNIGSIEKMEYTVIGDSVNLASRMESMTKEYGTDLLIPKSIQEKLEGRFVFEKCRSAKVKGKAQAIEIFKVRGYVDSSTGQEVILETPYSTYASEKSDKVVHESEEPSHLIERERTGLTEVPVVPPPPPLAARRAADGGDTWDIRFGEETIGPFTNEEVHLGLTRGELPTDSKVRRRGEQEWRSIADCPEFELSLCLVTAK